VPAGVDPAELEPVGVEPGVVVPVAVPVAEPLPVAVAEPESVAVAVAEPEPVSVSVALPVSVAEPEEVVSMGGTEMGWPAAEHWETTMLETEIWSETSQAFWTQGVTLLTNSVFWQWQAKSVRDEQPSVVRAVTKQLSEHFGTSGS